MMFIGVTIPCASLQGSCQAQHTYLHIRVIFCRLHTPNERPILTVDNISLSTAYSLTTVIVSTRRQVCSEKTMFGFRVGGNVAVSPSRSYDAPSAISTYFSN